MKILHLEDNSTDADLAREYLRDEWPDCEIMLVKERAAFVVALKQAGHDVILCDFSLVAFTGLEALEHARKLAPDIPFIFFSGTISEEVAVAAVRDGASDYILKERPKRLVTAVRHALSKSEESKKRRDAEAARRRSEARFRLLVNQAADAVFVYDEAGNFREVNRCACDSLGYTEEELLHKRLGDIDAESTGGERSGAMERVRCGIPATFYTHYFRKDRSMFPVEVRLGLFKFEGEELFLALVRDVTERCEAELKIREQSNLLNQAHDAIAVSDLGGRIIYWNKGAERLLGWTTAEVVGQQIDQYIATGRVTLAEEGWRGEISVCDRKGRALTLETRVTLVRNDSGEAKGRLVIGSDVTEKNQLREQFFRAQRLESLGMLAAGIAHDLNNVLAPMHMVPPMLRERATDPRDLRMLTILEASATRGIGLVRQIMGFAQGTGGEHRSLDLKQILNDLLGFVGQTFPSSITLEQTAEPDLWRVLGSSTQIHQVLLNLCINARDAMPAGGTLRIQAKNRVLDVAAAQAITGAQAGRWLVLEVADTGTGIPPDVVEHLWDPFFTTKAPGKGTGLGLSTVRGIVQSHGGFVTLSTEVGRGTIFGVYLPAMESAPKTEGPEVVDMQGSGELIFVIDDEPGMRELITTVLSHNGYRVFSAEDGTQAVAVFASRSSETRLVVTDLNMPGFSRAALATILRRLNPGVQILAVSGLAEEFADPEKTSLVADAFLLKPFKIDRLLSAVKDLLAVPVADTNR